MSLNWGRGVWWEEKWWGCMERNSVLLDSAHKNSLRTPSAPPVADGPLHLRATLENSGPALQPEGFTKFNHTLILHGACRLRVAGQSKCDPAKVAQQESERVACWICARKGTNSLAQDTNTKNPGSRSELAPGGSNTSSVTCPRGLAPTLWCSLKRQLCPPEHFRV